ncbi:hypothetical protein BCR44DRAFT_1431518 [Catenaria anguillulae PL171]|uniref:Secreted protein n=1 Tax=Catenaria anguillulae PL171 TaxID=765915 RepID=A0A1Y2HRB7_9FUNG|nr:hypothetical protein BCR44DRAFT_1443440 [Catenaria anguillulae PL171]ORZ34466.1 hypothetical protein BCR44DRAFT_1436281 [Catenaria anguillulae PL171]ORZ37135.1 hypothetical protein BCR44DRAFT_1431511 [Catenaria anguillulae PL171]ORZ37137.1 hypothetical protein BCR44DRAFT_1431518 [Catenaria anguillulae PL171]
METTPFVSLAGLWWGCLPLNIAGWEQGSHLRVRAMQLRQHTPGAFCKGATVFSKQEPAALRPTNANTDLGFEQVIRQSFLQPILNSHVQRTTASHSGGYRFDSCQHQTADNRHVFAVGQQRAITEKRCSRKILGLSYSPADTS